MRAIFLADAHLRQPQDQNYQLLLDFLEQQQGQLDALFLLGDIFEFWIGYEHLVFSAYIPLLEKLRRLSATGTQLYFVEGNHDFHLGPYFTETLGCKVIPDQDIIECQGKKLLICHGDLLNPSSGYKRLRSFWRSRLIRGLARIIHPDPVWSFGIWLSNLSGKKSRVERNRDPLPLLLPFAEPHLDSSVDAVVCGHFHQPLSRDLPGGQLIAVGDWIQQFSYAEMRDGRISLKNYRP